MPHKDPVVRRAYNIAFHRRRYRTDPKGHMAVVKRRVSEIGAWVREQKIRCQKCGEDHPAVLDFHHRDRHAKSFTISTLWRRGWSKARIAAEIAKCDVLCSNCHRKVEWEFRSVRRLAARTPA